MGGMEAARKAQLAERERHVGGYGADPEALGESRQFAANGGRGAPAPIFQPGHVLEAKTGGYLVLSRTTEGCWWLVHGRTCSCPAGRAGRDRCWHRTQVAAFVAKLDEATKRPVAPPNVSALVD